MKRLPWLLQRLTAVSPLEIPYRLRNLARDRLGRFRRPTPASETPLESVLLESAARSGEILPKTPLFPFVPTDAELNDAPDSWKIAAAREAERFLRGEMPIFELEKIRFGAKIDWNRDYSTGKRAPLRYAPTFDVGDFHEIGDVKYLWEPARLQFSTRLAQSWRYGGGRDDRIPTAILAHIADFIESAPFLRSIHWTSALEAALRLISLTQTFQFLRNWRGFSNEKSVFSKNTEFLSLLLRSIAQHIAFVDRRYSAFSSAGNHRIAEASGVYFAANYWSTLKIASKAQKRAKKILLEEIQKQIFPDGVCREATVSYSFFDWDLFALAGLSGEAIGDAFPDFYWERLEKTADFLDAISDRAGHFPNIGDEDGGAAFLLEARSVSPVLAVRAAKNYLIPTVERLRNRSAAQAPPSPPLSEKAAWFFGKFAPRGAADLRGELAPPTSDAPVETRREERRFFPNGGYGIWRETFDRSEKSTELDAAPFETLLVFKGGPFGYPATAAHSHADALEILLSVDGVPILVDPGTFSYRDVPERRYYRESAQHNTLNFTNSEQSRYINRFLWGKRGNSELLLVDNPLSAALFCARVRWFSGETHSRRITRFIERASTLDRTILSVSDRWRGSIPPTIRFHFAPGLAVEPTSNGAALEAENVRVVVENARTVGDASPNPEFFAPSFCEEYLASPEYGKREPGVRLIFSPDRPQGSATTEIRIERRRSFLPPGPPNFA